MHKVAEKTDGLVVQNERSYHGTNRILMKRKCKNVDITDTELIRRAIHECFEHKGLKAYRRSDVKELMRWCDGSEDKLISMLQKEIETRNIDLPPVRHAERYDRSNGKLRHITIEHIKQQIYDYLAYDALDDIAGRIGQYQIAFKKGQGTLFGVKVIQQWMNDTDVRYAAICDIYKCYPNISKRKMMIWLRRHVKNDDLIYLISCLLATSDKGLPIGSYLSIRLCALYLSDLYHFLEDGCFFTERRGKRINAVKHVMFNMDDIYVFGSSAKGIHSAVNGLIECAAHSGLEIKSDWKIISLSHRDADAHVDVLGYRIYRDRITMRHRNYVKVKQAIRKFGSHPTVRNARSLTSYDGLFIKHTNSCRFQRKYRTSGTMRTARKVVSTYDKSKIRQQAASSSVVHG